MTVITLLQRSLSKIHLGTYLSDCSSLKVNWVLLKLACSGVADLFLQKKVTQFKLSNLLERLEKHLAD